MNMVAPSTAPVLPEKHLANRRAFGALDGASPLLQLYCTLVAIELALKDYRPTSKNTHDIVKLAKELNAGTGVDAAADGVYNALKVLACTAMGSSSVVRPDKYPDIRYTRVDSDFSAGSSLGIVGAARDAAVLLRRELDLFWKQSGGMMVVP